MWRSVILMRASRAGLPTFLAMSSTKLRTAAREWLIAGATWVTPALAYSARLAVRTESSLSLASAIFSVHGRPATPMIRSPASRGASSASSFAAAAGTSSPDRSTPAALTPGRICVGRALAGAASRSEDAAARRASRFIGPGSVVNHPTRTSGTYRSYGYLREVRRRSGRLGLRGGRRRGLGPRLREHEVALADEREREHRPREGNDRTDQDQVVQRAGEEVEVGLVLLWPRYRRAALGQRLGGHARERPGRVACQQVLEQRAQPRRPGGDADLPERRVDPRAHARALGRDHADRGRG